MDKLLWVQKDIEATFSFHHVFAWLNRCWFDVVEMNIETKRNL